jgi:isopropylmalate/homocitrate/citramalate synthase
MTPDTRPDGAPLRWAVSPFNHTVADTSKVLASPPRIADCTLRDGEQQAGVVFSRSDKVELAKRLDAIGVHDLEAGTPAVSEEDRLAIEDISRLGLRAMVSVLVRALPADVDLAASIGVNAVRISFPISERQRRAKLKVDDDGYIRQALEISGYARTRGLGVIFSPYDTTRCDLPLLERLLKCFQAAGCVDRIRLVDTVGAGTPETIRYLVGFMAEASGGIPIEVHCHDDFGLATANTIAGALAGAAYLSTTMNGIGERAGNAPLEEVVVALRVLYGIDVGIDLTMLPGLSAEVVARSGVPLQPHKAVVGENAFAHETGMVVAGLLKDPFTAEAYDPGVVGRARSIVLGKKSGRAVVEYKLQLLGFPAEPDLVNAALAEVKRRAIEKGRVISDEEFRELARRLSGREDDGLTRHR